MFKNHRLTLALEESQKQTAATAAELRNTKNMLRMTGLLLENSRAQVEQFKHLAAEWEKKYRERCST